MTEKSVASVAQSEETYRSIPNASQEQSLDVGIKASNKTKNDFARLPDNSQE